MYKLITRKASILKKTILLFQIQIPRDAVRLGNKFTLGFTAFAFYSILISVLKDIALGFIYPNTAYHAESI